MENERLFSNPTGHGFAAEQANNLVDRLHGKNATVVGGDNAKNGADRKILNRYGSPIWIQDKYYSTASNTVNAAFDNEPEPIDILMKMTNRCSLKYRQISMTKLWS